MHYNPKDTRIEDVVEEMLAILTDRNNLVQKLETEQAQVGN